MQTNDPAIIAHIKSTLNEYERLSKALEEVAKEYGQFRDEAYASYEGEKPNYIFNYWEPLNPCTSSYSYYDGFDPEQDTSTGITLRWQSTRDNDSYSMEIPWEYLAMDEAGRREYARKVIHGRIDAKIASLAREAAETEAKERAQFEKLREKFGSE